MEYLFLIIGLSAAGFFILYLVFRRIIYRWFADTAQLDRVKQEVEKMIVELNHTTGRNIDLIEERIGRLREIMAVADKRISVLKRETDKSGQSGAVYSALAKKTPASPAPKRESEVVATISLRDKVLNLYHAGFTSAMIANQLNSSIGEVELIISLAEKE